MIYLRNENELEEEIVIPHMCYSINKKSFEIYKKILYEKGIILLVK